MRTLTLAFALLASPALAAPPDAPPAGFVERLREREAEILARVEQMDPDRHAQLLRLRDHDRRRYVEAMWRLSRMMRHAEEADPELKAQMLLLQALRQRHPDGLDGLSKAERKAFEGEVRAVATRVFELKQAHRRARLEELRTTLAELEADVAARDADREARIDAFVARFLEGPVDL